MNYEIDWTKSMQQTFKFYSVDPITWKDKDVITTITSCDISRDSEDETLGSASINISGNEFLGELYVRVYMIVTQSGKEFQPIPLGTFLLQENSSEFDGKIKTVSVDGFTSLMELKENMTPVGFSLHKGDNIMDKAIVLTRDNARAPVPQEKISDEKIQNENGFVSNNNESWLSFISSLVSNAKFYIDIDPLGNILFSPKQDFSSLQPVWTYTDDNSSILHANITMDRDIYSIPNVVEIIYSSTDKYYVATAINDDPNSPISTINRGRKIIHREVNPETAISYNEDRLKEYANQVLRNLSTVEYSLSYTHGYCPVRVNDCVRFNYERAGLRNIKAKVVSQTIKCSTGCSVSERAIYTTKLWR